MTPNHSSETVRLNVGGTKYEVSNSLIKSYPESLLFAKWIEGKPKPSTGSLEDLMSPRKVIVQELFFDRNGVRFQYVLDYMRDQKVHLAAGFSQGSIRQELDHFGFKNVPADAIDGGSANLLEVAEHVVKVDEDYQKIIGDFKTAREGEIIAYWIYKQYMKDGSLSLKLKEDVNHYVLNVARALFGDANAGSFKPVMNKYLSKYGLVLKSHSLTEKRPNGLEYNFFSAKIV